MPEVIEVTTYSFSELSDTAKQAARDWWVNSGYPFEDEWYESVQTDAVAAFACLGVEIEASQIQFRGFCSQGDGASFKGEYRYPGGSHLKAIKEYAPEDQELHAIASRLDVLQVGAQLEYNAYWKTKIFRTGNIYVHSGTMYATETELDPPPAGDYDFVAADTELQSCMRALADWYYRQLGAEWDRLHSNPCINECLTGANYRFDEAGAII